MITRDDVERAAKLARLRLRADEVDSITRDLERIVGYVQQLQSVDVDGVEPMTHPMQIAAPRRADEPAAVLGRRAILQSAGFDDGVIHVPKVIE